MKTNIKTFVDIEEVAIEHIGYYRLAYSVTFTEQYDVVICGINFGTKTKKTIFPFFFSRLDIAKDFCGLKPTYTSVYFYNDKYSLRSAEYSTYAIHVQDKTYYIKWEVESTYTKDERNISFGPIENPIVDSFVTNIKLKDWMHTHRLNDVEFYNEKKKLSEIINFNALEHKNKKWHFELIENNGKN